ncbi:MAG: PorP/SprF family type IX secretion system membrane protein, partial [Bacteroidetes bacterium]|nr:PorP/SprF family type IX secretion system membrane protein [Bacteroidota bacterium]
GIYYIVGVLPLTGCSDTTAVLVTVNPKPTLVTSNPGVCFPATANLTLPSVATAVPGTTPGLTYTYFMEAGAITPIPDETAVSAGTYFIVGTTSASCSDTTAVTVTINPKPNVITTDPAAECFPIGVDLTLPAVTATSTPGLVYGQFFDAGATLIHPTPDSVTVGGVYYIVGIDLATTCSDTTAINVIIKPKPVVVINTPSPVCSPDTVNLTLPTVTAGSTAGLTLSYYTDAAATNLMLDSTNVLVSGTYYIVGVLAATGCSDTSAVFASVDATAIGGSVGADAFVCNGANGDTLTLTGASNTILKWQYSITGGTSWIDIANTTTQLIYSNLTTTTWYRAITTEFCADAISIEARITVDTTPLPIGGTVSANDTVCSGVNSDTLLLSGHTGNIVRWEYSIDNGATWVYVNNTTASLIYTNLTTTTIFHAVLQSSICNFAISSNDTITVDPVSVAGTISGGVSGCAYSNGATLTLLGYNGAVVNWQYSIDEGTTWIDSANITDTMIYSNLTDTVFYRVIVNSGVCLNDTSDAAKINIYPKPLAMFVADTACFGVATTFLNMSTIESGIIQLNQWDFGNSSSSTLLNPTHIFVQSGVGAVSLITTSNLGCLDTATVSIFVDALPDPQIISSGALSFCCGGSVSMSGLAGLNYSWSTSATTQAIVVSNCLASGSYALTVTDPATLCQDSSSVAVVIFPNLIANAGTDNTISLGDSYTLNGQGGSIYSWLPATGLSNPNIFNPIATPVVTTTYELTVADINGCMDLDSITITVIIDFNLTVSNLMTANGDGYNDIWIVKNIENYPGTEAIVVNREGQQVFYSSSYDNTWLGLNKNGHPLPDGTYYYFLKLKNSDKLYKGPLTIGVNETYKIKRMKKIKDTVNNKQLTLHFLSLGEGIKGRGFGLLALACVLVLIPFGKVFAQQLPFSSQYYSNPFVLNPAYTGINENISVFLTHRSQWTGLAGSPKTSYFTIDGPIRAKNSSVGLKVYSDVTDIISRVGAFANYSYKFTISDSNNLYFGVACGVFDNKIDFSKAQIRDTDDPFLSQQAQNKTVFSADLGIVYVLKKLTIGFAVPQILGNRLKYPIITGDNGYYNLNRHYQGTAKYVFDVSKEKAIIAYPLIMVRSVKGAPLQYDVNGVIDWKKIGWLGATYHSN